MLAPLIALALVAAPPPIALERTVPAKPAEVFAAWTTVEGMKSFLAPDAKVELKPGGAYEPYFVLALPVGQRGAEGCTVVSFEPNKKLVFTWSFPPTLPALRNANALTQVAVELIPDGAKTQVKLTHTGFKEGADWEKGRAYFEKAWGFVLARLERRFTRGPIDWKYGWVPAQFTDLAWMQGQWRWTDGKASREETWAATPTGLIGSYRETGADPAFYELAVIEREGNELVLSMRMFGPGLVETGKTKAGPLRFLLESFEGNHAVFLGEGANKAKLEYRLIGKSSLEIRLERPAGKPEVFTFTRA
jgi:uncharacterized protein YndB with AHSA1/START domain